jgi:phage-related protein
MLESGVEMVSKLADGFFKNLPTMITTLTKFITETISFITKNFPKFVESGLKLLSNIADGFIKNLPEITNAVVQMVTQLIATITQNLPQILQQGIVIIGKLVAGLIQAIPQVVAAIPKIISSIVDTFGQYDWLSIGINIIKGIAEGITGGLGLIKDAAVNAAKTAFNNAKDFLKIASPSKLMRDQVGRYISEGIAVGIEDNLNSITNSMNDVADLVSQPIDVGEVGMTGGSGSGNAYNSSNSVVINVYGAAGQNVNELAEIVSRKINASVNRRGAAWA